MASKLKSNIRYTTAHGKDFNISNIKYITFG